MSKFATLTGGFGPPVKQTKPQFAALPSTTLRKSTDKADISGSFNLVYFPRPQRSDFDRDFCELISYQTGDRGINLIAHYVEELVEIISKQWVREGSFLPACVLDVI